MSKEDILVIDDNEIVLKSCKRILESENYSVTICPSATEGIEIIEKHKYDLIILDIVMPGCNGLTLSGKIKDDHPGTKVLIISGYMEPKSFSEIIKEKKMDFLSKPFTPEELLTAVKETITAMPANKEIN